MFQNTSDLFGPGDDGTLQKGDAVLASAGASREIDRRHRESGLSFNLATDNGGAREEIMEAVHDLPRGDLSPLGLVVRVR